MRRRSVGLSAACLYYDDPLRGVVRFLVNQLTLEVITQTTVNSCTSLSSI